MYKNRADQIAEEIQELVFSRSFQDGERLDEIRLAKRFGVSRTPLREALKKLTLSGIVEKIPNRGVFVRQPGPIELLDMFEVMSELESICGKLAAKRITDIALKNLHEANSKCKKALKKSNPDSYYLENELFHKIIYNQSGNSFLERETIKLQKRLEPFRRIQLRFRGRIEQSMSEHEAIVEALSSGDAVGAECALRNHVSVQGDKFHQLVASFNIKENY
ncbi:MAG: GntR family transcriptional regulator [Amylibacter sp.]|jgi:DNA-binding GntR family transcriptional regulator|tara:strand:+ start:1103 stop:1762 length:660 start_codon:yes stop_codon:yes gene_type:complete